MHDDQAGSIYALFNSLCTLDVPQTELGILLLLL